MPRKLYTKRTFFMPPELDDAPEELDRMSWTAQMPSVGTKRSVDDTLMSTNASWATHLMYYAHASFMESTIGVAEVENKEGKYTIFAKVGLVVDGVEPKPLFHPGMNIEQFSRAFDRLPEDYAVWISRCVYQISPDWDTETNPTPS